MVQSVRQLTPDLASKSVERRSEERIRTTAFPARLTDLYRERVPVIVLNVSESGLGLKVDDRFIIGFPVLVECEGLVILANVRHCMQATEGGYVLGLKIQKTMDAGVESKCGRAAYDPRSRQARRKDLAAPAYPLEEGR
jgi:hypothetical protein